MNIALPKAVHKLQRHTSVPALAGASSIPKGQFYMEPTDVLGVWEETNLPREIQCVYIKNLHADVTWTPVINYLYTQVFFYLRQPTPY